jgi:hypothetical protein
MKRLLSIAIAVSILVFWGSPGFTGEKNHGPAGKGGPVQHVTGSFLRDTANDINLSPLELIADLNQLCMVNSASVKLSGDIVGVNPLLSDVFCFDPFVPAPTGRDEAVGWIDGTLDGKPIYMLGRMTVDLILPSGTTDGKLKGYFVFEEGVGTHYGVLSLEGIVQPYPPPSTYVRSSGTYTGWVRKNK